MDRIGLFFVFVACAGISIIVWVFNWICWVNQCCCCDFLHNPVNKRIAWWLSFIFLLGILACCIAGFVSVNRFGFAVEGSWCAVDRIYYDIYNKPLSKKYKDCNGIIKDGEQKIKINEDTTLIINDAKMEKYKTFLDKIHDIFSKLIACKVLAMIYFCLLLIAVTAAGISMMFYACLKRQGYLITFMHVLWNIIRFFIVSFFLFGTAFGVLFLIFRDSVAVVYNIFEDGDEKHILGENKNLRALFKNIKGKDNKHTFTYSERKLQDEDEEGNCDYRSFMVTDIHLTYRALNDASIESRKLSALSLCSSFFGAIAVYFFLLVLHHYNNDLFFDQGKSIFKGFTGVGGGYRKKHSEKDPAFKKRKYRAEIELTSKNDENSNYNEVNKNENDDD